MAEEKDYSLEGLENIPLTPEQKKDHRFTNNFLKKLEVVAVLTGLTLGLTAGVSYGIYKCLPQPAKQYINQTIEQITSFPHKPEDNNS